MGRLLIITGPPGSGKSTVSRLVADRFARSVLVTGDSFFAFLASGSIPPWLPGSAEQNDVTIEAAALATGRFARGGYDVVFDGMIGPWYLERFTEVAAAPEAHYAVLLPDEATCVDRVATRVGHGFRDEPATRHMHREFLDHPAPARHVLAPPPDEPGATADRLLELLDAGALRIRPGV